MEDRYTRLDVAMQMSRRVSRRNVLRFSAGARLAATLLPLLAACGGDDDDTSGATSTTGSGASGGTAPAGTDSAVDVVVKEFAISLSPTSISAGKITFNITNAGTMEHEFVILKTDIDEGSLKMNGAGSEVDEDASGTSPGAVKGIQPGKSKSGTFDLVAGKYVMICNIAGHYKAGMHASLDVM